MDDEKIESIRSKYGLPRHYYGDTVRRLFVLSAIIMVLTLPLLQNRLPVPPLVSILSIVFVGLFAGFLAPRNKWSIRLDVVVSLFGLLVFEYYAVEAYKMYSFSDIFFIINQILAVIFLFALYNSAKTIRSLN